MGDIADWMFDQAINGSLENDGWEQGETCRYCGEEGLEWAPIDGRWRLTADGEVHACPEYAAAKLEAEK